MLLNDEPEHPGHVSIGDHLGRTADALHSDRVNVPVLHRFCLERLNCGDEHSCLGYGLVLRRAHLGWATEQYEIGSSQRQYLLLGMQAVPLRNPELYQRYWRVRKMRYACKACRYYVGWF
ncbi:hypothetical protein GCM10010174_27640 [Kutzneria viridogrisea]|uniref:Uncharacterized protein n=2 Tax=Kutzneria TaxID=43356 RepID=W5W8M8_9PSEU|nr:hypothetical protein [Kutzneria albida]AHH97267.1 hypothetical protein KALB_3903 [Kutzneria albida DSM 43870]MBA8930818.1 hypothetical protein [Kutzneria viridogrisea]